MILTVGSMVKSLQSSGFGAMGAGDVIPEDSKIKFDGFILISIISICLLLAGVGVAAAAWSFIENDIRMVLLGITTTAIALYFALSIYREFIALNLAATILERLPPEAKAELMRVLLEDRIGSVVGKLLALFEGKVAK